MAYSTNYKIAISHLSSRVKQSLVAMLSVTFGISMYVFMNSFMSGVNNLQSDLAFSTLAHIRIYNDLPEDKTNLLVSTAGEGKVVHLRNSKVIQYKEGIRNADKVIAAVKLTEEVAAVTPQVNMNVFYQNGATRISGLLSGIEVENEDKLFGLSGYVVEGDWEAFKYRSDGIVMGVGLASKLGLKVYENVLLQTADGISRRYTIVALIETSLASVDRGKAFVKIASTRQLLSENRSYATDIQVNVRDYNQAEEVAQKIAPMVPYEVESWKMANGQMDASNLLRDMIALAVSLTILLVAGFGIYNIMNMTVNEKIREIAILKAMGFESRDIVQIFLTQSVIIGIIGGLVGLLLGYLIAFGVNHIPFEVGGLANLPMAYQAKDYGLAFIFGLITTFVAGYLPAKKASSVDPVSIIRG
ncbi:MAG: FtsX-like permease family protein [Bacteroidota bacterium]